MRHLRSISLLAILLFIFQLPLAVQSTNQDVFTETVRIGRGTIQHVEWQPDGALVLADTVRGAWLYSVRNNRLEDVAHIADARLARFSPDGHLLAGVNEHNEITLWDSSTFTQTRSLPGHDAYVRAVAWNPDGKRLASMDRRGQIIVWDTEDAQPSLELRLTGADQIAWSREGSYLAALESQSGQVNVWDAGGVLVSTSTPEYPPQYNSDIIWQDDTHLLRRNYGEVPSGDLLDIPAETMTPIPRVGYASDFNPDGSKLAIASIVAASIVYMDSGQILSWVDSPQAAVVAWSPNGQYIAFGAWTSSIHVKAHVSVVEAAIGEIISEVPYDVSIKALAWNSDSTSVAVVTRTDQLSTVEPGSSSIRARNTAHIDIGNVAAWRGDGRMIAAANTTSGSRLWDAETGDLLARTGQRQLVTQLDWQPGGTLLATAGGDGRQSVNNNVYVWDSAVEAESIFDQNVIIPHVDLVAGIAWSPDGTTLATVEQERYIRLWKPAEPDIIRVIDTWAVRLTPYIDYTQRIISLGWSTGSDVLVYSYSSSGNGGGINLIDVAEGAMLPGDTPSHYGSTWAWTPGNHLIWAKWGQYGDAGAPPPVYNISIGGEGFTSNGATPIELSRMEGEVTHAIFSPDASILIGFDGLHNGVVWELQSQTELVRLANVHDAVWSPDSELIATYGTDGLIRIVSVETGDTIHTFHQHYREEPSYLAHNPQVIWSPDSQRLAVLDGGVLFIYLM